MNYIWQSVKTWSYWRYAIVSKDGIKTFFAVLGAIWLIIEIAGYFKLIDQKKLPSYSIYILLIISLIVVIFTRRPVNRIKYKMHGWDLSIEVRIGNLFEMKGQKIISTNTTFDTDIANGIISPQSLQGQFTSTYFSKNINELDSLIDKQIAKEPSTHYQKVSGKNKKYPIGTTVRVDVINETFYLLAMSDLNVNNTAQSTFRDVMIATESVFKFIAEKGENSDIIIPIIGTGKGRITTKRKSVIARIAQEFIKASEQKIFSNKLIIAIHPKDAENFEINLYEVRDLLNQYLP